MLVQIEHTAYEKKKEKRKKEGNNLCTYSTRLRGKLNSSVRGMLNEDDMKAIARAADPGSSGV